MRETAIISGGTRGLGRALSLGFGAAGYRIVALYREHRPAADLLEQELAARGIDGACVQHDVTSGDLVIPSPPAGSAVTLVNNACASFEPKPMHLTSDADVERDFAVGVAGAFRLTRSLLRRMVGDRRGTVINVLSSAVDGAIPKGFASYAMAKAALRALTQSIAVEYGDRGVRAFSVSPGYMDTDLTRAWSPLLREAIGGHAPPLAPEEVARRIVDLARSDATPGKGEGYPLA